MAPFGKAGVVCKLGGVGILPIDGNSRTVDFQIQEVWNTVFKSVKSVKSVGRMPTTKTPEPGIDTDEKYFWMNLSRSTKKSRHFLMQSRQQRPTSTQT